MRRRTITASLVAGLFTFAPAQQVQAQQFEVASVKPSPPDASRNGSANNSGNGRLRIANYTLKRCIMGAYGVGQNEIIGGPDWVDQDGFEIQAKADSSVGDEALMKMLRDLLAERFKLAIHREAKTLPVYVLEVGKNGPKLEKAEGEGSSSQNGRGHIEGRGITMAGLAWRLGRQLDRPVVDRTGLAGQFNYKLEWTPEGEQKKVEAAGIPGEAGLSVFAAIQQQLGLKLEPQKAPVEVLVIDHAEKPTEN